MEALYMTTALIAINTC